MSASNNASNSSCNSWYANSVTKGKVLQSWSLENFNPIQFYNAQMIFVVEFSLNEIKLKNVLCCLNGKDVPNFISIIIALKPLNFHAVQ